MIPRFLLPNIMLLVVSVIPAACGSGGGSPSRPTDAPGTTEVFPNPYDPRLLRVVDAEGHEVLYRGRKDTTGVVLALDSATVRPLGRDPLEVMFDSQQLPQRIQAPDGSGLHIDWFPQHTHFRFFDELGAVIEDVWFDRATRRPIPRPSPAPEAAGRGEPEQHGHSSGGSSDQWTADDPLVVDIAVPGCGGAASAAADVELCQVEFSWAHGQYRLPATRHESGFRAELPRNLTPYEWRTEQCRALFATLGNLCVLSNDAAVSDLLNGLCVDYGALRFGPKAALVCALASLSVSVLCSNIEFFGRLSCSAAVIVTDPFGSMWTTPGERTIRAVAFFRGCQGIERRISATQTVDPTVRHTQLVVDGCLSGGDASWNLIAASSHVGAVMANQDGAQVLSSSNPGQGWIAVGSTIPRLGPHRTLQHCYWLSPVDPLFDIQTEMIGSLLAQASASGSALELSMDMRRTMHQLRPPTQAEIQAGAMTTTPPCLTARADMTGSLSATHVVRLRPFQRLVVDLELSASGGAEATHMLHYIRPWPPIPGTSNEHELRQPGRTRIVVTHDDLRYAYEHYYGQLPFPPGWTNNGANLATQCLVTWFFIGGASELLITEQASASSRSTLRYSLRVERE